MRRAGGLLKHLSHTGAATQSSSAIETSRLLHLLNAEANPLHAAGVTHLVSCADFRGQQLGGGGAAWGSGRSFSSGPVQLESDEMAAAAAAPAHLALDPQLIADAAHAGELDAVVAAGELGWLPTRGLINGLSSIHDSLDIGWIPAIALTTAVVRTLMFPVMIVQQKNTAKMSASRPEMEQLVKWLKEQQAQGGPAAQAAVGEYQTRIALIWQKYDCHPLKSMATIAVQAPAFLCFFAGLRHMAAAKVPSMVDGGALWFPDLTLADPTYALPILCSLSFLATVELGAADGMQGQPPEMMKRMKTMMRILAVVIVPFTASMPASVFVYWCSSNIFSMGQTALLKMKGLREFFGLPPLGLAAAANPAVAHPAPTFSARPPPSSTTTAGSAAQAAPAGPQTYDVSPMPVKASSSAAVSGGAKSSSGGGRVASKGRKAKRGGKRR